MMHDSPKTPTGKTPKGQPSVIESHGRLQIRFRYGGKRLRVSVGLPDTPINRGLAEQKAQQIYLDIVSGNFDETLAKYKPERVLATDDPDIKPKAKPKLQDLWARFVEWKRPQCSPSTMHYSYKVFTGYVERCPIQDLDQAADICEWAVKNIPQESAYRWVVRLNAMAKWAVENGAIATNPFDGRAAKIKPKHQKSPKYQDFTAAERDKILTAIQTNQFCSKYANVKHSHYYPYVFLSFHLGLRPSELIALQWRDISADWRFIHLRRSAVESDQGLVLKDGLKTQKERRIGVLSKKVQTFLQDLKPADAKPTDLVIQAPRKGGILRPYNLGPRLWKPVLNGLGIEYRKLYTTRHTAITGLLDAGIDAKDVGRLVGNTPQVIYENYAGNRRDMEMPDL